MPVNGSIFSKLYFLKVKSLRKTRAVHFDSNRTIRIQSHPVAFGVSGGTPGLDAAGDVNGAYLVGLPSLERARMSGAKAATA